MATLNKILKIGSVVGILKGAGVIVAGIVFDSELAIAGGALLTSGSAVTGVYSFRQENPRQNMYGDIE